MVKKTVEMLKDPLLEIFGERACFNEIELSLYSRDINVLPDFVMKRIKSKPDAVVQPESVEELERLLRFCSANEIPVVPRGAATSGYGGAVPSRGGVVVDFCRMNRVIEINEQEKTAEVEPGVVWDSLERTLNSRGLALRLYPNSGISATVGGWVANGGGVGIGSYEFGSFREDLIECEVVTPKGVKKLSGADLDLVFGLAGTTGLLSKIKFKVREQDKLLPLLAAFENFDDLVSFIRGSKTVSSEKFKPWHVSFKNARNVRLSEEAVEKQAKRNPLQHEERRLRLPKKNIALVVARSGDGNAVKEEFMGMIGGVVRENKGEVLNEELARLEWEDRFKLMKLKALGPSLIISEVRISTENLRKLVESTKKRIGEFALEGTVVSKGDFAVVLGYVLDDERKRSYLFTTAKGLIMLEEGKKLGGYPYTAGMYLTDDAELCLGENLKKAYEFKKSVDEKVILNPGKVFPIKLESELVKYTRQKKVPTEGLNRMLRTARKAGIALSLLEKLPVGKAKMKRENVLKSYPFGEDALLDTFICLRCGYCMSVCPVYKNVLWESASPRGMFYFIKEFSKGNLDADERMLDIFFVCATCEKCNIVCPVEIPILQRWDFTIRPALFKGQEWYELPSMFKASFANVLEHKNAAGNPHENRVKWLPEDVKYAEEGDICYWAGCIPSYTMKNMAENALRILNRAEIVPVYLGLDEWCCGAPIVLVGRYSDISDVIKHNIEEFDRRGVKKVITSCPGCWITLALYYPVFAKMLNLEYNIEVMHISQVLEELIKERKIKLEREVNMKITYHDPCHIGRAGGIYDPPRNVLKEIPGIELVEMERTREEANCCGRHVMRYPVLGSKIVVSRVNEAVSTGAEAIVTPCASCMFNFNVGVRDTGVEMDVYDISDLVALSMGMGIRGPEEIAKVVYNVRDTKQIPVLEKEEERWKRLLVPQ
ncbi:MAG: FAD-binding and (Fe-S)-binding domain-containing protein [archaeon]|nr:FAD-binding and (Fe-S)-binding domain-containing protein [archaeon]